ncbi:DNA-binding transcription repressor [Mortierella alpina]|nr:DNA-binding transcription repressor [Mortierella alpina]
MSSGTTATVPADASPPEAKRVRLPLQSIQGLVATGSLRLSSKEIQLFRQRGILRSETASRALEAISETAVASPQSPPAADARALSHAASSPDQASRSPSAPAAAARVASPSSSSSSAASVVHTTPTPSPRPSHRELAPGRRSSVQTNLRAAPARTNDLMAIPEAVATRKQSLPTYHLEVIEDTCSHLRSTSEDPQSSTALTPSMDISTSFRRHSESFAAARSRLPPRSASIAIAESMPRRDSSTPPTVVPTPQGMRTILYAASPAHTLYSLPIAPLDRIMPNTAQSHTSAMGAFKFPSSPTTPPPPPMELSSPSPPPAGVRGTSPASAPGRSKRKGLAMRSPSMSDSQDQSPGVIFQLPFGTQSTRRSSSATDHNGRPSGITPPSTYPSPATSSTQSAVSCHAGADASGPENPPLEPAFTRGLGIHLQGHFTEERVPHPFDTETANRKASVVDLPQETINDQCMPTPQSDSPQVSFKDALVVSKADDSASSRHFQPTTPIVVFSGVELGNKDTGVRSAGTELVNGSKPERSEKATGPATDEADMIGARTKSEGTGQQPQGTRMGNQEHSLQVQDTIATAENCNSDPQQHDSTTMPLWAQRQLSIRRQSLIPRPELDFVRGSGILPAASKDLVLPDGGAVILTYPVLLSDIVKVAQDDAHDRSEGEQDCGDAAVDSHHASAKTVKRRKASHAGKKRESISAASGTVSQENEGGLYDGASHAGSTKRLMKPASVLPEAQGAFIAMVNGSSSTSQLSPAAPVSPLIRHSARRLSTLGSPVEISTSSTFDTGARARRGSKAEGRRPSQQELSSEGESDRSGSQQDSSEVYGGGGPNELHKKGKAKKRELLPKAVATGKIATAKNSMHMAGPMHSPMDIDLDLDRSSNPDDSGNSRVVQKRHLQEEYDDVTPSTPQQKKAKKGAGSQQHRVQQLATPQSDRHHAASPGLNEDFELASTLLNMHDGVLVDSPSRPETHRQKLPVVKKPRTPKSMPPKPVKATNASPKKTPTAAPKPPRTPGPGQKHCEACGATETPCWRPGYTASTVLCNSCGLRYKKSNVYCTKLSCKYIPLKTEYAAMEAERVQNGWDHLRCQECGERVALPILRNTA